MYMITPMDHMSHERSYFSGPSTSGAKGVCGVTMVTTVLTHVVGRVARSLEKVCPKDLFSKSKVCQL